MKIKLGPIGNANDPWYVPPKTVEIPDRPADNSSGGLKLAPAPSPGNYSFGVIKLAPVGAPAPDIGDGLGTGPASGNCDFGEIKLAPVERGFWDGPVSGEAIKLAPVAEPLYAGLGIGPASRASANDIDEGEYGSFRKGARKFKVGDKVRSRKSNFYPDAIWTVVAVQSGGFIRCEAADRGVAWTTESENLSAA